MAVASGQVITKAQMDALALLANIKFSPSAPFTFNGDPWEEGNFWINELNRIHSTAVVNNFRIDVWEKDVSGPWPVTAFNSTTLGSLIPISPSKPNLVTSFGDYNRATFYHEDTGSAETITAVCTGHITMVDATRANDPLPHPPLTSFTCRLRIGGDRPVTIRDCMFVILVNTVVNGTDASRVATCTTDFPGAQSFQMSPWIQGRFQQTMFAKVTDGTLVSPGVYTFNAGMVSDGEFSSPVIVGRDPACVDDNGVFVRQDEKWPRITLSYTDRVEVSAIHSSKKVYKVIGSLEEADPPFGIYPELGNPKFFDKSAGTAWVSTTPGIFAAITQPVKELGSSSFSLMPWNIEEVLTSGTIIYKNPIYEQDLIPHPYPARTNFTPYSIGIIIQDSNGNLQTVVQQGTSAGGAPTWSNEIGAITIDGTVRWRLFRLAKNVPWPSKARMFSVPRFPFVKVGETNSSLIPSLRWQWFAFFQCRGWWIYSVSLNRIGTQENVSKEQSGEIPVTIGCIRNGSFVSFGTYNTGQTISVFWPVFTSTELAYDAAERVEIHATFLNMPAGARTVGTYSAPIAAPFYNDLEAIIQAS